MKIVKEKYPFKVIIEDKIGKTSGKKYQSISIGHTAVKNKDAIDPSEKYETKWFNFFSESDLLTLANTAESAYQELAATRQKERQNNKREQPASVSAQSLRTVDELNDDIPF